MMRLIYNALLNQPPHLVVRREALDGEKGQELAFAAQCECD